jgi:hypothetical protein
VFTCRPRDYLEKAAMVPRGKGLYAVTDDGFTRAVDLGRALALEVNLRSAANPPTGESRP